MDDVVADGPDPALVMALTLKVYEVKGVRLDTSAEVASGPCTRTSFVELGSGPKICTLYPVMTPFRLSFGTGDQDSFAVVGSLW